jgi:hypothetical protein
VVITAQPRSNNNVTATEPIIANLNFRQMFGPLHTLNIALVSIIKIVIARNKIYLIKVVIHVLQGPEAVTQGNNVQAGPVVVPVAEKQTGFTTLLSGFGSGPFNKVQTVVIMGLTVGFQSKMYVCEDCGFFK